MERIGKYRTEITIETHSVTTIRTRSGSHRVGYCETCSGRVDITKDNTGMDAVKFEYRHKGGAWMPAEVLLNRPGTIAVPPTTPGTAEQIEIRAVFLQKNDQVGNFSDAKPAFIAP